ncbi:MAG TPA: dTDP-4-dehydrorhamnose 3,5-epimerase [Bacteroidales bacterium]|nr:dTDP-4-dehydrorhamnose 3,5-epimerase [Bacteroidales bacterium]HQH18045.1 dTDP-4-dehydrorhamnose 3,5-epimerase [Bacteroidales bacterium]HQI45426.1 dTDP-4-dehydrorhamnose 3,5-epimerase [Bacteroidales bacterium]
MKVDETPIEGLLIIQPDVYFDERGYFLETYNKEKWKELGINFDFMQDNQSQSSEGVLRGLHFQNPPYAQGKLVSVIAGAVIDIAVDLRKKSKTYGSYFALELSEQNKTIFWIPPGFAHGFVSLQDNTIFSYKCTQVYNKQSEASIRWDDTDLAIDWKIQNPIISEKDRNAPFFKEYISMF